MAHEPILISIERFLAETGMSASYFGAKAVRNSKLVPRLRAGRPIHVDTADAIREFMATEAAKRKAAERLLRRPSGQAETLTLSSDLPQVVSPAGA